MKSIYRYIIALAVVGGICLLVLDRIIMPLYVGHQHARFLPDLNGLPFEEARHRLELEGFSAQKGDVKHTDRFAPGTVIDQYPRAMRRVKPGRTIRLTVAEQARMVVVPDVVGMSIRSAKLEITEAGLSIDSLIAEYDQEVPKDVIRWQYPRPADHLRKGSGLTLIVSKGKPPDFYQVPQLFGLSLAKAEQLLQEANLEVGRVTYRQNEDLVPYTVLDQSVEVGTILPRSMPIDLTVSILDLNDVYNKLTSPERK